VLAVLTRQIEVVVAVAGVDGQIAGNRNVIHRQVIVAFTRIDLDVPDAGVGLEVHAVVEGHFDFPGIPRATNLDLIGTGRAVDDQIFPLDGSGKQDAIFETFELKSHDWVPRKESERNQSTRNIRSCESLTPFKAKIPRP